MDATEKLTNELRNTFNAMDMGILEKQVQWGLSKYDAMIQCAKDHPIPVDATEEQFKEIQSKIIECSGGKSWYNTFLGKQRSQVNSIVKELFEVARNKRNALIARKLSDAGIWVIHGSNIKTNENGFSGLLSAEASDGVKIVHIESKGVDNTPEKIAHQKVTIKVE